MRMTRPLQFLLGVVALALLSFHASSGQSSLQAASASSSSPVGIFQSHGDVGEVLHPGSVEYNAEKHTYTMTASGLNMWLAADAFQFAWKKISGDATLTADISFADQTGNPHKKAVLIFRQSLDADSVYVDVALHASGMTALQYREQKGGLTKDKEVNGAAPQHFRIIKKGDDFYMALASGDGEPQIVGDPVHVHLDGEFYAGIGVCSHDKDVIEKAMFKNVEMKQ